MAGDPEDQEDAGWFLPTWATDDQAALDEGPARVPLRPVEADYGHPLLQPLARAQDAVARLETRAACASAAVAEGLRARISYREAAGWLAHAHVWIHPHDLALRDGSLTGSYGAAFRAGRLRAEIPSTVAREAEFESSPSDIMVDQALRLARLWRRLAELRTWRPVADAETVQETLQSLGCRGSTATTEIADWVALLDSIEGPPLIRAGRAARDWMNRPGVEQRNPDSIFLAASLWRETNPRHSIPLPFWSAPEQRHHRLSLHVGLAWLADFLDCVAAAAKIGMDELERLQRAEDKGRQLQRTARSRLQLALDTVLRTPVTTARDLGKALGISTQAALGLLRQLSAAEVIQEATGRASWRAFAIR